MTLVTCPECSHEVSDQANACVNCGYPLKHKQPNSTVSTRPECVYGLIGFIFSIVALVFPFMIIDIFIALAAFTLSLVGLVRKERLRGLAIAGIAISAIALIAGIEWATGATHGWF